MFRPPEFPASQLEGCFQLKRAVDPATMRPRMAQDGSPRLTDDGRVSYSLRAQYVDADGVDDRVTVAILNPPTQPLPAMSQVRAVGSVRATAWDNNGRQAWSLLVDGITPVAGRHVGVDPETGEVTDDDEA